MLVLTRKTGEGILIGDDIRITIVETRGSSIRVGISAPREMKIHRLEVYERIKAQNLKATQWHPDSFTELETLLEQNRHRKTS